MEGTARMGVGTTAQASASPQEKQIRFRIAVQRTRGAAYLLGTLTGTVFSLLGSLDATTLEAFALGLLGILSAVLFYWFIKVGAAARLGPIFDPLWLLVDAALITWVVQLTGGASSPWFPWYLANIAGAAFVLGQWGGFAVFITDTLAYLGVLGAIGHLSGFNASLYEPLMRMVFMYGASFLFLRGVGLLKEKREVIRRMRDSETRRVEELTRLTAALDLRTRELAEANLRIREADRLKSQFLANMSHELRTPLNSIIGFSDVVLARLPAELPAKQRRFIENINSSGQHLLSIINDILDLSKIEAGRVELHPESAEVLPLIEGVCTIVKGTTRSRGISFEIDVDENASSFQVDPVKLKQILFNLVSNASKFSDEGATVTVRVRRLEGEASPIGCDAIQMKVIDRGVGIDSRDHRVIFEEFRQLDGTSSRAHGGTGLGLALVRRLVELHHGTIKVDSARGAGSTFTVTVPHAFSGNAELVDRSPETLDIPSEEGRRILVVEDDPTAYEAISRHLGEAGFIPVRARNSDEAIRLARLLGPFAITLDIILPGLDGWEILRMLKAGESTRDIPVIIVSVLDNRELAVALGAADYFVKPVDRTALVRRLTELLPRDSERRPRLLLIDDEPELHDLVEAKLTPLGYDVAHAMSGRAGLQVVRRDVPDLILLDLMMEEMDGFEVAAHLKADPVIAQVPVVVLTAKDVTRQDRERLRGKIEALVGKTEMPHSALATTIKAVLARKNKEKHRV